MYAANLLVLLTVLRETFLLRDNIQTRCKQAKHACVCRQFFPHNAPRRPTVTFQNLKASYFAGDPLLFPHSTAPHACQTLYHSRCTGNTDTPSAAAAAQLATESPAHHSSWGQSPRPGFLSPSPSKQHNRNAWATLGRSTRTGQGAVLAQKTWCAQQHAKLHLTLFRTQQSLMRKTSY